MLQGKPEHIEKENTIMLMPIVNCSTGRPSLFVISTRHVVNLYSNQLLIMQ